MTRTFSIAAAFAAALALSAPASAQDAAVAQARACGAVGEQADGYLGLTPGGSVSADLRGRVDQINIQRRALYTRRAAERSVSVNEMAAAVACEIFQADANAPHSRIAVGERYRDEAGQWRQRTSAAPIPAPSFCGG